MKASETIIGQWYMIEGRICFRVPPVPDEGEAFVRFLRKTGESHVSTWLAPSDLRDVNHLPDCTGYDYQPPAPDPVYRPFANAAEFTPFRERWILDCGRYNVVRVYDDKTVNSVPYSNAFGMWTFDDGKPFGILESKDAAS